MNWIKALSKLQSKRRHKDRYRLSSTCHLEYRGEDIAVRMHSTDIIVFYKDGRVLLTFGGWQTVTTKARLNVMSGRGGRWREPVVVTFFENGRLLSGI